MSEPRAVIVRTVMWEERVMSRDEFEAWEKNNSVGARIEKEDWGHRTTMTEVFFGGTEKQ